MNLLKILLTKEVGKMKNAVAGLFAFVSCLILFLAGGESLLFKATCGLIGLWLFLSLYIKVRSLVVDIKNRDKVKKIDN